MAAAKSTTSSSELEVQVLSRGLIKASRPSEPPPYVVLSLSNFDLISGNHPATLLHIYPRSNGDRDVDDLSGSIKTNLPPFLNHFFPLTGRITTDPLTSKPQVLCNNEGAELVEARANAHLADVDFRHLNTSLDAMVLPYGPDIALCVQVVHFSCGGFSLAWTTNHMLADAAGLSRLSRSWAEFVRAGEIARPPVFDRSAFQPRTPPRFSPALDRSYTTVTGGDMINVLSAAGMLSAGFYYVESSDLDRLQSLASRTHRRRKSTRMQAFSAHVWKVLASAVGEADTACRMGWFVDGRRWMGAGEGYMGNVFSCATGEAGVQDLISAPLPLVADKVGASIAKVANKDHFLDLMDLVECRMAVPVTHAHTHTHTLINRINLGLGSPAIILSPCHNLPVESEFGFGQAALAAFHSTGSERLGMGFMQIAPSTKGDGSWVVSTYLWPKVARALESDLVCAFKPLTAEYLGLRRRPSNNLGSIASRL